jgi:4-hydroxythreonine-4-phosphate dehydrogenase
MMQRGEKPVIAITAGDPAGIGPETIVKALTTPQVRQACRPLVFGDLPVLERAARMVGMPLAFCEFESLSAISDEVPVSIVDLKSGGENAPLGQVSAEGGRTAFVAVQRAVEFCMAGNAVAMVTAPLNKESLQAAAVPYLDHTAMLKALTNSNTALTMFATGALRTFFMTRHLPFREIAWHVTKANIVAYTRECCHQMRRLGFERPRLAVAALNPHGGEHGLFGDEEVKEIGPAVQELREVAGLDVHGPIPADSVYHLAKEGAYDAVISLYHDQGHIAAKTLDFYRTVSLTLGLPFLRTSVDHGTAFDIAGTGKANEISMVEAILAAATYGPAWRQSAGVVP